MKSSCAIFYCSRSSLRSCCRRSPVGRVASHRGSTALNSSALTGKFYYHFTLGFVPYFVLGYYLVRKEFSLTAKRVLYALGVLGFVLTVVLTSFASRLQGAATELFYGYDSLNVLFVCVGLFVFAKAASELPELKRKVSQVHFAASCRAGASARTSYTRMFIELVADIFLHFNTLLTATYFSPFPC